MSNTESPSSSHEFAIEDELLSELLKSHHKNNQSVVLLYSGTQCKVFYEPDYKVFQVDPDKKSFSALKSLANKGLLSICELSLDEFENLQTRTSTVTFSQVSNADVILWYKSRRELLGLERGPKITDTTSRSVWADAAGRCMYRGCGKDLSSIKLSTKSAQISYLAHIVASSPGGPRGDIETSHALSDDSENIMLMCDEHHRLIDRVDVLGHTVSRLRKMRGEHKNKVRTLLASLSNPNALIITLLGNIAMAPTDVSERDARSALINRGFCPLAAVHNAIRLNNREHRTPELFWNNLLDEYELEIKNFIDKYAGTASDKDVLKAEMLSFFPLTITSIMVLAGRVIGEARATEIFQYDRQRQSWQWDGTASAQPSGFFEFNKDAEGSNAEEVLLSIEVTAPIDESKIPEQIKSKLTTNQMPWVRLKAQQQNPFCIKHPEDLEQFANLARYTVNYIQDNIRAKKVHLIIISPASSVFRFGQLLQAGHHPEYVVYDRPDHDHAFRPALSINGQTVVAATAPVNGKPTTIALR